MNQQTGIFTKETEITKNESNGNSGDEKCNNWNEKLPRGTWQKILQVGKRKKISELEDRSMEIIISEEHRKKIKVKKQQNLRNLLDNIKHTNLHLMSIPEEKEKKEQKKFEK